jgi:hypothetical protein
MARQAGLDWDIRKKQIDESRKMGDPLALMIDKVNWLENEVVVLLENPENPLGEMIPVTVNFEYNAYKNVELYYTQMKKHTQKEQKTQEALNHYIKQSKNIKHEIAIVFFSISNKIKSWM